MKLTFLLTLSALTFPAISLETTPKQQYRSVFLQETAAIYAHFVKNPGAFSMHGSGGHDSLEHNRGSDNQAAESSDHAETADKDISVTTISNTATAITDCHMQALALYPLHLQNIAYQASAGGDTSEQARLKFVNAVNKEQQQSALKNQQLTETGQRFLQQANHCMSQALAGTPLLLAPDDNHQQ